MAGLPLYFMAIPLRRSLAASMNDSDSLQKLHRYNVAASAEATAAQASVEGGRRSLHAVGNFAIVGQAHRLPLVGNRRGCPTITSIASNLVNRQCPPARCRHR